MKRGACILLILVMVLGAASVIAEPTIFLDPVEAYETNEVSFSLNISNYQNTYEINSVQASAGGFDILALVDYKGWTESFNGSLVEWTEGSLGTNIVLALFEYLAEAPFVEEDTETETTVTLIDADDEEQEFIFPIIIKNDDTPPELSDIVPEDGDFVKEGTTDQPIRVRASDPETGIANATFRWVRCNFEENITPEEHTTLLAENSGLYQAEIDLSSYENEQQVCFDFTAYNKGGESSGYEGVLTVDGVPPNVTLVSPDDGAIIGLSQDFSFFAADNLATVMTCSMYTDGAEYIKDIEAEHMEVVSIPSADVEEGEHTWSMECADPAGWVGESATWAYTLDKTPPQIVMTAPENNSIIADSTLLEFEVTDNYQLESVWFVYDGNETEVEGVFSIDVTSWPEGPSEFAVIAEDSVGNQAELTYQVIIDRTPPQVELVNPVDNGTSDVHVNFTYRVQDNYDDASDCTVYVDDEGQGQVTAEEGIETVQPILLAVGDYRWNVQCVDDADNTGSSDERQLFVIDTTGPDIAMNNPDVVFRGDPVTISLEVTDISGVESVEAELRDPNGDTQSIPLENVEDAYTASVETTMNSTLGTYTLEVYAVDTLNNSNSGTDEILLTYRYVVDLELSPSTATPSSEVTASGTVAYDNRSSVPEESVEISLPGNVTEDVMLESGSFSHLFTAPAEEGSYDVTAGVASAGNGQTYTDTEQLAVATQQQGDGGSGGGGGGGSSSSGGDSDNGGCNTEWRCTAWSSCSGGKQTRSCSDLNHCSSDDARRTEKRSCTVEEEEEDDDTTTEADTISATREPLQQPEEHTVDAFEEDEGNAAGVGKASGFMSLLSTNRTKILLILLLAAVLIGTLYKYGWAKGDKRKKPAAVDMLGGRGKKMDLESYLEGRASRKGKL